MAAKGLTRDKLDLLKKVEANKTLSDALKSWSGASCWLAFDHANGELVGRVYCTRLKATAAAVAHKAATGHYSDLYEGCFGGGEPALCGRYPPTVRRPASA